MIVFGLATDDPSPPRDPYSSVLDTRRTSCRCSFPTVPPRGCSNTQNSTLHEHLNSKDLEQRFPRVSGVFHPNHLFFSTTSSPSEPSSTMRHPPTGSDSIQLTVASGFAICDSLLRMAHCLMVELPEAELRSVRYTLEVLSMRANQLLDTAEFDLSLNLDGLAIDQGKSRRPHTNVSPLG